MYREEWEWIHKVSLDQRSRVPGDFKNQLTVACKHLLNKLGEQLLGYIRLICTDRIKLVYLKCTAVLACLPLHLTR